MLQHVKDAVKPGCKIYRIDYTLAANEKSSKKGLKAKMSPAPLQTAKIICPNCGLQFSTQIRSIIDVGQNPAAKEQLLQNQINVTICPQCGHRGALNAPFLYHDPQKELLFTYTPPSTSMSNDQQQKFIGSLINTIMSSLPSEKRKGYLLQPRTFLDLETMIDEIIMADGVSRQELDSQKRKTRLLGRLLDATSDEVVEIIAQENKKELDYQFFLMLNQVIEHAKAQQNQAEADRLQALRDTLFQYSETVSPQDIKGRQGMSRRELVQRLLEIDDEQQQKSLIAVTRPMLDYAFFQTLTGMIEEAQQAQESEKAEQLLGLRSKILDWIEELDTQVKKVWQEKADLIKEVIQSPDWKAALEPRRQEIDSIFFSILGSNIEMAQNNGDAKTAAALQQLLDLATLIVREHAPPEVKLLNKLFEADYPAETRGIMEENRELLNQNFVELLDYIANDLADQGHQEDFNTLQQIRAQVAEIMNR